VGRTHKAEAENYENIYEMEMREERAAKADAVGLGSLPEVIELYAPFLAGKPVDVMLTGARTGPLTYAEHDPRADVRDGRLVIVLPTFNFRFMLGHEIAHVIECSDEEFMLPRIGLSSGRDIATTEKVWREIRVFTITLHVLRRVRGTADADASTRRALQRAGIVVAQFNGLKGDAQKDYARALDKALDAPFDEAAAWAEWERKLGRLA